jgi:hypothetical protein
MSEFALKYLFKASNAPLYKYIICIMQQLPLLKWG